MDDVSLESILEAVNYIKEYGATKEDLHTLVSKEDLENFREAIMEKLESLQH